MEIDRGRALLDVLQDSTPVIVVLGRVVSQLVLPVRVLVVLSVKNRQVRYTLSFQLEIIIVV